jgi:SCP1.201-like deaminase
MRLSRDSGFAGTVVINSEQLRRAASDLLAVAQEYQAGAGRYRNPPLPDMPPGVRERVVLELSEVACLLGSEPTSLLDAAQELRVRALWADIADKLMAGYELEGAQLDEFKAAMASGALVRYVEPWEADLAREYAEKLKDREHPGGFLGFVKSVGSGFADFFKGAFDAIAQPVQMIYRLTPLNDDFTHEWAELGSGLAYGATHPLEFGKAVIGVDMLEQHGFAYWLGNLAPNVAAAFFTGGGAAAMRGAAATDRIVAGAADASRIGKAAEALEDANRAARAAEKAEDLARAARKAEGLAPLAGDTVVDIGGRSLPAYAGGKTQGVFESAGREPLALKSGYDGPTAQLPKTGNPGMNNHLRAHVEAQAAAEMRLNGIREAELYLNRIPCLNPASASNSCELMLERMLPEGAKLTVHGPHGFVKTYVGRPD